MPSLFPDPDDALASLEGTLERVTFTNAENGWSVVRVQVEGEKDLVTAVGTLVGVRIGEALRLRGEWVEDKRYGRQFKVASYITLLPTTVEGIGRYLASGVLPGVGEKTAEKIVAAFGTKTLEVLSADPERLREVPGLKKRWKEIAAEWQKQRALHETMAFLQSLGIGTALAVRIVKRFGGRAAEVVKSDPYRLAAEVHGIGFLTADRIAAHLGIPPSSPERAAAAAMHALREAVDDGHCYLPEDDLAGAMERLLGPEGAPAREAIGRVVEQRLAVREEG
ncbi:MAG: ATP-dependent RecD-like DNA helicase, partial [Candidatus Brocadiae bacterium]|nr:ATP-dependent RecD-like DNA helicase [Candidatus Brocadiia bacterium]